MTYRCFNVEIADNIAHIQLKRGDELNTMVPEFWSELPQIVRDIDDNARARVIVISSTGKHFSAGMHLSAFTGGSSDANSAARSPEERGRLRANVRRSVLDIQETFNVIDRARMPVLMAIQGGCVGGAVDFASACDCRYATADAFFVIQEINIGMTADVGTFPRLCLLMPQGMVRELAYTGRRLSAQKALEIGLVNAVFRTPEEMLDQVMSIAKDIEDCTYWNPFWGSTPGLPTSNIHDLGKWGPILGTGRLISPAHFQEQIAPTSVGKGRNRANLYFAYGFVVANGWIAQNPSINGYLGAFGHNLANGVTIVATKSKTATTDAIAFDILREVTKYVTPATPINF